MMQKKDVEKYIAAAMSAARDHLTIENSRTKVNAEYDGYAASLGASIITSGLKPALAFYTDIADFKEGSKQPYRFKVLKALAQILANEPLFQGMGKADNALLEFALKTENQQKQRQLKAQILAASIALKLALRNFTHVKSETKS